MSITILVISLGIVLLGLILVFRVPPQNGLIVLNYLLTVVASAGALAGIAFALYGWFQSRLLPELVAKEVASQTRAWKEEQSKRTYLQQQAIQKVIASYHVTDVNKKIDLLQEAVQVDPDVFNGWISLGYAYMEKGDPEKAEEMFDNEFTRHNSYQAACDIAHIYVWREEYQAALRWLQEAIAMDEKAKKGIAIDPRFGVLREKYPDRYGEMVS